MEKNHNGGTSVESLSGSRGKQPFEQFWIADWSVDTATSRVTRGDQTFKLEPRVMEVLEYLATRPGEVVSREELESEIWKGTVVGYNSVTGTIQKLRKVFADDPKHSRVIETLSKRGYRVVATVRPAIKTLESTAYQNIHKEPTAAQNQWLRPALIALLVLVSGIIGLVTGITAALTWFSP